MQTSGSRIQRGIRSAKVKGWSPGGSNPTTVTTEYSDITSNLYGGYGGSNANWRDVIARGGNATNNYDAIYHRYPGAGVSLTATPATPGDHVTFDGFIGGMGPWFSWDKAVAAQVTGQATANALRRMRSGFSAGTFLGELREALTMMRHPAQSLRKLTDQYIGRAQAYRYEWLRRGLSRKYLRDASKALPDLYLEYKFGWAPLAQDISAGYDAVNRAANKPTGMRLNGTARSHVSVPRFEAGGYNNFPTSAYRLRISKKVDVQYSARVVGSAKLKLGFGVPAFQAGSTIPDFIPTMWNLAPWSFLIDYFSNVGDVLEARATASLITMEWGAATTKAQFLTENVVTYGGSTGTVSYSTLMLQRRKFDSASIQLPSMQFDQRPSGSQSMNIAALVASKLADRSFRTSIPPGKYSD